MLSKIITTSFIFIISINLSAQKRDTLPDSQYLERVENIHKKYITIDSHNDSALWYNHPDKDYSVTKGQVTFNHMKNGGLDAAFFAIYLDQKERDKVSLDSAYAYALQEIALFKEYVQQRSNQAEFAFSPADLIEIKKRGKSAVILAIENGYAVGDVLERVDSLYNQGARYITLSHNLNNNICDASMSKKGHEHNGLSDFGKLVIKRMNDLGMLIDVSHASSKTLFDVLDISSAPIIASHSGAWEVKNHNRNLKDNEMRAIAEKGGVIQVATGRFFLSNLPKAQVTVKHLADHIDHVVRIVGIDHVGLGTDFDGGGGVVGLENASKMKNLTIELLKRGYSDEDLGKFWGGNIIKVWEKAIECSKQ